MILNSPTISGSLTVTGNIITSGSITLSGSVASASYAATASFVALAQSASNAVSAQTASFANAFTVAGNLTAQTLVVQTITSSVDFVTGSTRFGSVIGNTHVFTGSMSVSGSGTFASSITATNGNFSVESSATNSVLDILTLTHTTSGTAASGLGAGILFRAERPSSGITLSRGAIYGVSGTDADDDGDLAFYTLRDTGAGGFNEKMRITSGGNVGIGTTTPGQLLEVVGGEIKAGRVDSSIEGGQVSFGRSTDNATAWYIDSYGNSSSTQLRFVNVTNAVVAMTITGSNVGIGTSSPNSILEISSATPIIRIQASDSDAFHGIEFRQAGGFDAFIKQLPVSGEFKISSGRSVGWGGFTTFYTDTVERMRITSGGFVGIQTSSPTCPLHVLNLQSSGGYPSLGTIGTGTTAYFCNNNTLYGMLMGSLPSGNSWIQVARTDSNAVAYGLILQPLGGSVTVTGALSKGSGTFRIDHPLESKKDTHHLIHSFVEGPRADLIYRGKVTLVNGTATINIDTFTGMTEGTFTVLNRDIQCFTTNESGWDLVKGKVEGNILTITSQNTESTDEISWMVVGERQDKHIKETDWTDENGKPILEPLKSTE